MKDEVNTLEKMFAYNLWANTQIIGICGQLSEAQLEMEVMGVYGRIHNTLVHLIRAEGGYIHHLTQKRPWANDFDWENASMATLLAQATLSGQQLMALATTVEPAIAHHVQRPDGERTFYNWTVLGQAFYHGVEHRTQIKILLTQLGVAHPDLDVWDYTASLANSN